MAGLFDGVSFKQIVDGRIGGNKWQAIGQFEALLGKGALVTIGTQTHSSLVHQMQSHPRFDPIAGLATPCAQQVPCTQPEVLGDQKPGANLIAGDLIGEQLTHVALDAAWVDSLKAGLASRALGVDKRPGQRRIKCVEFFFEDRNRR